ncbi:MAG: hypothetical protein R2778_12245 [Saprospiraceae bacterium]
MIANAFYLVGFSNGGAMAAKCAVEMSDVLATVVESASSPFYLDSVTYTPKRKLPVTFQIETMIGARKRRAGSSLVSLILC